MIRREINLFFTALMFYTRLPVPRGIGHSEDSLNKSVKYFPLMGWIVGGISVLIFWGSNFIFGKQIAIALSMIAGLLLTGAFHEDGFADVCDGFGGGWTREDILRIMKDSRIGTFGTVGLIAVLGLKFLLLDHFTSHQILLILPVAHSLSRLLPTWVIYRWDYTRDDESSKIKPIGKKIKTGEFLAAFIFGCLPLLLFRDPQFFLIMIPLPFVSLLMMRFFNRWIGGYTGDCLGAVQQISEITVYLSMIVLLRYGF